MTTIGLISDRVDSTCDLFEHQWKVGETPRIEQYLPLRSDPEFDVLLLELASLELEYRRKQGERPQFHEYAKRFSGDLLVLAELDLAPFGLQSTDTSSTVLPIIGTFRVMERIGAGGFGTVWKAWDTQLERTVALKVPRLGRFAAEDELHHFLLEAQAAAKLKHPNIVSVFSVGQEQNTVYVSMEYVEGVNLEQSLKSRNLSLDASVQLSISLARGVSHAHRNGIIHRDLKPANVIIDGEGQPHITDFGLAKHLDKSGSTLSSQHVLGTVAYMSPEQATGNSKHVTPSSDVYSLGTMLYELLADRLPYSGQLQAVLHGIMTQGPPSLRHIRKEIPVQLETICLKAMARKPEQRYATADEFADELQRFRDGKRIKSRRQNTVVRWLRDCPGIAALYFVTSASLIALLALGAGLFRTQDDGKWQVDVMTLPRGASVVVYLRDPVTGAPMAAAGIGSTSVTPSSIRLSPGRYLVVAYIKGTDRFHEVERTVPPRDAKITTGIAYNIYWKILGENILRWPTINIPESNVESKMTFLKGSEQFVVGYPADPSTYRIPSFFIASNEFSVADFLSLRGTVLDKDDPLWKQPPTDAYIPRGRDYAIHWAEEAGGRLPTEVEFEYAARQVIRPSPEALSLPKSAVEQPTWDHLSVDKTVTGLLSGVMEWTDSKPYAFDAQGRIARQLGDPERYGIARGGFSPHSLSTAIDLPMLFDPATRHVVRLYGPGQNLGFRIVRSNGPRLKADDFLANITLSH